MNRAPDPKKYSMYAAFRTKERGEQRAEKKRESIYDLNRPRQNTQRQAGARPSTPSADVYRVSRPQRPTQQNAPQADRRAPNVRSGSMYGTPTQPQGVPKVNVAQRNVPTQGPTPPRTPEKQAQVPQKNISRPVTAPQEKKQLPAGTRVTNKGEDAYRYGFHSSYRTADGRILDGFDNTGRPIYRESGASAVVRHVGSDVDVARLHPVRRIRVETLVDTKKKPFPFMLVFSIVCCTAMVMGVLYSYMRLNECTNTLSTLNYRLGLLRNETNTLTAEVVRREDLIAIEQTAADTLGMVKNDVLTKYYVSIENEDKTEVFGATAEKEDAHEIIKIDLKTGEILIEEESKEDTEITSAEESAESVVTQDASAEAPAN